MKHDQIALQLVFGTQRGPRRRIKLRCDLAKSDDFIFSLSKKRFRTTEKDVETSLRRFAKAFPPEKRGSGNYRFWKNKSVSEHVITEMFGSFKRALDRFGIENFAKEKKYDEDQLLTFFEKLWRWRKAPPSAGDFKTYKKENKHGISYEVFRDRFGGEGWRRFLNLFADYKNGLITKSDLLQQAIPRTSPLRKRQIPLRLRARILTKFGQKCSICGASPKKGNDVELHVDHIVPFSKGGTHSEHNLRVLCGNCNLGRGNRETLLPHKQRTRGSKKSKR